MGSDKGASALAGSDFAAMTFGPAFNQAVIAATQAVIAQGGYMSMGQGSTGGGCLAIWLLVLVVVGWLLVDLC